MQHALDLYASDAPAPLAFADYSIPLVWNGVVLVGEAPGAEEARLGRPFVGRSGQLLDKVLAEAGIDRAACLIANVFRYRPPDNKIDHFFVSRRAATSQNIAIVEEFGKFGSCYCKAEYAGEIRHLAQMLQDRKPKSIIALGRTPLWALTGANGLLDKIGTPLPCRLAPDLMVTPTYHPSFILRGNWGFQEKWVRHLITAVQHI